MKVLRLVRVCVCVYVCVCVWCVVWCEHYFHFCMLVASRHVSVSTSPRSNPFVNIIPSCTSTMYHLHYMHKGVAGETLVMYSSAQINIIIIILYVIFSN